MKSRLTSTIGIIVFVAFAIAAQNDDYQQLDNTSPRATQEQPSPEYSPTAVVQKTSANPGKILEVTNWTTDTWTAIAAIVAFAALVQPWVIGLGRRLFKRGTVDIHETGIIEVGYSGYGATIGLMGTLRSRHRDMFVQWVKVSLVKLKDRSVTQFEWKAFRTPKISIGTNAGQSAEVAFETPFSFMVSTLQPHRFNVFFPDEALIQTAQPSVQELQREWVSRLQKLDLPKLQPNVSLPEHIEKKLRKAFLELSDSAVFHQTSDLLNKLNYWEPGPYQLTVRVQTARPNKGMEKTWSFTLLDTEVANLQNNVVSILEEVCGLPLTAGTYGFASAPYNR